MAALKKSSALQLKFVDVMLLKKKLRKYRYSPFHINIKWNFNEKTASEWNNSALKFTDMWRR